MGTTQDKGSWYCSQKTPTISGQRLFWFGFFSRGRADKQEERFQKARYRNSLVKDDVYGETMDEEYTLNY